MKKKVLLTGILSIVMCLSLIVGATLALFTSESKVNIAITSGKVEVTASVAVDSVKYVTGTNATWTSATNGETSFDGIGSSAKVTESSVKLNNIVPGDGLKFNVVVNNGSTVSAKSRIIVENDITKDTGLFDLLQVKVGEQDFNGSNVGNWQLIEPNSADVIIPVEIVFPSSCEEQGLGCEINLVVEAIQGNVAVKDSIADNGDNTYTINDKHGLIAFAKSVNAGNNYAGKTVTLATDVDLANGKWTPISSSEANLFNGTFDGGNYTISNLKVEGENHVGLFGVLKNDNATIKNVKIHNVDLKGTTYLGAVVGLLRNGNVENCHVSGTIKMEGNYMVGGIAGTGSHGIIKGCTVDGTDKNVSYLKATYLAQDIEGDKVGGIAGHTESGIVDRVVDCTVSNITVEGTRSLGGAVGTVNINVSIKNTSVSNVIVKSNASDDYAESQKISASAFCGEIFGGTSTTLNGSVENVTVIGKQAKYTGVAYGRNRGSEVVDGSTIDVTANNVDITILVSTNTELTTASADAFDGMVIAFENDIVGNSILDQKENVDVVIDGANYKYTGTMDIYGHARHTGTETLTIKNVNFVADENIDFISCNTTDGEKRYAHNVTVEDCNFNATTENGVEAVGMRFRQCYNITVKNVTAEGMHSLMWATGVANGINLEKIVMEDCLNGVSFGTSIDVSLKNVTIEATDDYSYGIRADFSGAYALTVEDCNITASAPVLLRYATSTATATFVGNNVLTANNTATNPDNYQVFVVAGDFDANKDVNGENPVNATIVGGDSFKTFKNNGIIKKFTVGGTEYKYSMSGQMANSVVMHSADLYPEFHNRVEKIDVYTTSDMKSFYQMCKDGVFTSNTATGWDATLNMMADINWGGQDWAGLPTRNLIWNGNGHTFSNLKIIANSYGQAGLFSKAANITINDLTLENVEVSGSQAGAFFGNAETCKLNNCKLAGDIKVTWVQTSETYNAIGSAVGCFSSGNSGMNILSVDVTSANITIVDTGITYPSVANSDSGTALVGKLYNNATFND